MNTSKKEFMRLVEDWENYDEDENCELELVSVDWGSVWQWIKKRDRVLKTKRKTQ